MPPLIEIELGTANRSVDCIHGLTLGIFTEHIYICGVNVAQTNEEVASSPATIKLRAVKPVRNGCSDVAFVARISCAVVMADAVVS